MAIFFQWTSEILFISGFLTGSLLMALVYLLFGLLFHQPTLPDGNQL